MRIIINVKYRRGRIEMDTRMDPSSGDKVVETNAGKALYDGIKGMLDDLQADKKEANKP